MTRMLAVLWIATGLVFAWAFVDKTFGLGYATPSANAWIDGGSPTQGFLGNLDHGPFASMFQSWAEYHVIYALVLIALAATAAGNTWGGPWGPQRTAAGQRAVR